MCRWFPHYKRQRNLEMVKKCVCVCIFNGNYGTRKPTALGIWEGSCFFLLEFLSRNIHGIFCKSRKKKVYDPEGPFGLVWGLFSKPLRTIKPN